MQIKGEGEEREGGREGENKSATNQTLKQQLRTMGCQFCTHRHKSGVFSRPMLAIVSINDNSMTVMNVI